MSDRPTLQEFLTKLTQNGLTLQALIAKYQQEIQEHESKIVDLKKQIDRHAGALGYNNSLSEDLKKQIADLELAEIKGDKPPIKANTPQ